MTNQEAIRRIMACKPIVAAIDASGRGIHYAPTIAELPLLSDLEEVISAAAEIPGGTEWWIDEMRQQSGMSPSSWGMLTGMMRHRYLNHPGALEELIDEIVNGITTTKLTKGVVDMIEFAVFAVINEVTVCLGVVSAVDGRAACEEHNNMFPNIWHVTGSAWATNTQHLNEAEADAVKAWRSSAEDDDEPEDDVARLYSDPDEHFFL